MPTKINWKAASATDIKSYKSQLYCILNNICIPENASRCKDICCTIHEFHDKIVKACLEASAANIPHMGKCYRKVIPGCNESVAHIRQQAIFWHQLWKCNNCPTNGVLADIRCSTQAK